MRTQVATLLGVLFVTGPALAHAHLNSSTPEASAVVTRPEQLSLGFSEALETRLSRIAIIAADGAAVADSASLVPVDDRRRMVRKLPNLPLGNYTVKWVAVSIDIHRTEGSYGFTIVP